MPHRPSATSAPEVVKIEPPEGDIVRRIGPARSATMGAMFLTGWARQTVGGTGPQACPRVTRSLLRLGAASRRARDQHPPGRNGAAAASATTRCPRPTRRSSTAAWSATGRTGLMPRRPAYDDLIQAATAVPALAARNSGAEPRYAPADPGRPGGGSACRDRHPGRAATSREQRPRPARRGSDVRDHGRLRAGRSSVGPGLRPTAGRGRLWPAPHPQPPPVRDAGRAMSRC